MPDHEDVVAFAEAVREHMPAHDALKDVPASRVALLARERDTRIPKLDADSDFWDDA
jgi:tRNA wybutosine-synthesizing protein 1